MVSRSRQTGVDSFGIRLRAIFIKNLLKSKILVSSAAAWTETALDIVQVWLNYFPASFYQETWRTLFQVF